MEHPHTLVTAADSTITTGTRLWRARCAETRTPGSEGGPGRRASREADTASRSDPYSTFLHASQANTVSADPRTLTGGGATVGEGEHSGAWL